MAEFLDELDGDFVVHTKTDADILSLVGAHIYPEEAPQGTDVAHIIYTMADGHRPKSHSGISSLTNLVLHVYAISTSQPSANRLARLIEEHWLATSGVVGAGTLVQVCNGGRYESGAWHAKNSSGIKLFHVRLVLKMLLGE